MKIKTAKNALQDALVPLAKAAGTENRLILTSGTGGVYLATRSPDAALTMRIPDAAADGEGACSVGCDLFREAVDRAATASVEMELCRNGLILRSGGNHLADLPLTAGGTLPPAIPKDADQTPLPTGFGGFLNQAMHSVSREASRRALQGVNLSSRGLAASDGHQMCCIPLPMITLKEDVILPPSPLYHLLRRQRWSALAHWRMEGVSWAGIRGTDFVLSVKTIDACYPSYWKVFPPESGMDVACTLQENAREAAISFLKTLPKPDTCIDIRVFPDRMELADSGNRHECFHCDSVGSVLSAEMKCNGQFLLQALRLGHETLSFNSRRLGPIVATGGSGRYLFMPMGSKPASEVPVEKSDSVQPQTTQPQKENKTMIQTLPVRTAAPVAAVSNPSAPAMKPAMSQTIQDPLSELTASIAAMREHLEFLQTRLNEAGRRIREAVIQQKQKERIYQDASRKLEKIRMAV